MFEDVEELGLLEDETKEEVSLEEAGDMGAGEEKYDDWKDALAEMEAIAEAAEDAICKPCERARGMYQAGLVSFE